jgi:hypothetical protein
VSLLGDTLREVSVTPLNNGDLFYVGNGNYIWNIVVIANIFLAEYILQKG